MNLDEALEVLEEAMLLGDPKTRLSFEQLDGRIVQLMKEMRKRSRADPGSKSAIEPMIRVGGEIDVTLSKLERSFIALEIFAKKLHI